jgi:hypothetical protein
MCISVPGEALPRTSFKAMRNPFDSRNYLFSYYCRMGMVLFLSALLQGNSAGAHGRQDPYGSASPSDNENGAALWFEYGMNFGAYFAHSSTANYYNGSGGGAAGRRSLEQMLRTDLNYNRIRQDLGYDFGLHALPAAMRYNPSVLIGFFGSLHFSRRSALIAEFNYARLRVEDQFTLRLDRFSNIEGDNIERFTISGSEERVDLRLGYQQTFLSKESYIHPFVEAGFSLTDTKVNHIRTQIGNSSYSLFHASTTQYTLERDFGISPGGFAGAGLKLDVNENFRLTLGYSGLYTRINLGENDRSAFQHTIYMRLNLDGLLRQGSE